MIANDCESFAPPSHGGGQGFKSPRVHFKKRCFAGITGRTSSFWASAVRRVLEGLASNQVGGVFLLVYPQLRLGSFDGVDAEFVRELREVAHHVPNLLSDLGQFLGRQVPA